MREPLVKHADTINRINVTPIIDVALVLVIILLITAPMITAADVEVQLPEAKIRKVEDEARVSVTMSAAGEIAIDDEIISRVTMPIRLAARLEESRDENILVVVRADASVSYDVVDELLKDVRESGARRIAIATRQRRGAKR
jgi:biopolymer transport protein ExbD